MTIGACSGVTEEQAEKVHNQIRSGITGGLSNVWHRKNISGETKINHLCVDSLNRVVSRDSSWTMNHANGVDFNSLYPFSVGSIRTPSNPCDNGLMYMPGNLREYSDDPIRVKELFNETYNKRHQENDEDAKNGYHIFVTPKAHMLREYWNEFINMLPVFRNMMIDATDPNVVGKVNGDQIKKLQRKRGVERRLTCLLDIHGEFQTFSNYYIFFLIDYCHLVIDEFREISVFHKTDCFKNLVTTVMGRRIEAIKEKNKGVDKYSKMIMNASYGFNIKNNENYAKVELCKLQSDNAVSRKEQLFGHETNQ
ncbi:hypothetical protein FACS189472_13550 [Alphaproteobacteria bacterium]|nr:hypothetical protein FACS189472_13550 [Alphaproteobacteria bacterium]